MRCTVCGCDILPNSICCQNCGTRVIEMTGVNSAQPRYGNNCNNSFNNSFDNGLNSNVRAVGKNMSIGKKVLILLLALFVGAAIGFGYWYYHNVSTHTIREENFSIELPRSLEKETTIDYAAQSSDGTVKANGKYADVDSDFQYMILDYSSLAGETTDILTEKLFVTYMKGNLKSQFGSSYKEVYASGNKLKMTYRAKTGTIMASTRITTITVEMIFFTLGSLIFNILSPHLFCGFTRPYWRMILSISLEASLRLISSNCTVMSIL